MCDECADFFPCSPVHLIKLFTGRSMVMRRENEIAMSRTCITEVAFGTVSTGLSKLCQSWSHIDPEHLCPCREGHQR